MAKAGLAYPSDNAATGATFSMTNPDSAYPATNGNNLDAGSPLKSSTTSSVLTLTLTGSTTLKAFAIVNHNLAGATCTLTNTAGYSQAITIPARSSDAQCVNAWRNMSTDANPTATIWTLTITGASAAIAIGEILMLTALRDLNWRWGTSSGPETSFEWPKRILRTFYGARLVYDKGIRIRTGTGTCTRETDRAVILALAQSAKGASVPFFFVPDQSINDAWMAVLSDESRMSWTRIHQNKSETPVVIEEVSSGLVL